MMGKLNLLIKLIIPSLPHPLEWGVHILTNRGFIPKLSLLIELIKTKDEKLLPHWQRLIFLYPLVAFLCVSHLRWGRLLI